MSKLKLFTSPSVFPNPQRVRLLIHEKGIADQVEEQTLDMMRVGEQRQWRHLKRNPWGETPALGLADGTFISEAVAIGRYLDLSFSARKMMCESPAEQALDTMLDARIWMHPLSPDDDVSRPLRRARLQAGACAQCRVGPVLPAAGADACRQGRRASRRWSRVAAWRHGADLRRHHAVRDHRLFEVPAIATPLDERFEHLHAFWRRWKNRESFRRAYGDGRSGIEELTPVKSAA